MFERTFTRTEFDDASPRCLELSGERWSSFFLLRTYPRACDLAQGSFADVAFSEPTLLFSTRLKIFFPALRAVCSDPSHTSSVDQSQSQIWRCHENFDRLLKSVTVPAGALPPHPAPGRRALLDSPFSPSRARTNPRGSKYRFFSFSTQPPDPPSKYWGRHGCIFLTNPLADKQRGKEGRVISFTQNSPSTPRKE